MSDAEQLRDRFRGTWLGLAAGDALGTTLEFSGPGPHGLTDMVSCPFRVQPRLWKDDPGMALCLAASLVARQALNAREQMVRYLRWRAEGCMSRNERYCDIGNAVAQA